MLLFAKPLLTQRERTGKHTKDNTMSIGVQSLFLRLRPKKLPKAKVCVRVTPKLC